GTVAMALPLAWQIVNAAGWVAQQVTSIFENIGVVQEGMSAIARPIALSDRPGAKPLAVTRGEVKFDNVRFGYGRERGLIDGLTVTVRAGEKIGLVGRSGAGKSTLVNLLLRFFDLEDGRILIDGQDIAAVTQESLRAQISVVTQDTSLLHRSIRDNIRYGKVEASDAEIVAAAKLAHAHEFIEELEDWKGRRGYDAQVGERGVKLSGGQRQRVAIARVILKDARSLLLARGTPALDSEVEAATQASLGPLMAGRTVIAIAHRLSTIAQMDRLVVLERGRIVEQGSHDELLRRGGHYAALWRRQSGGFVDAGDGGGMQAAEERGDGSHVALLLFFRFPPSARLRRLPSSARRVKPHASPLLQITDHVEQILGLGIPARAEHPDQALGRGACRRPELLKSDGRLDVIAQDNFTGIEIPAQHRINALDQKGLGEFGVPLDVTFDQALEALRPCHHSTPFSAFACLAYSPASRNEPFRYRVAGAFSCRPSTGSPAPDRPARNRRDSPVRNRFDTQTRPHRPI